jgi:hypothetical protein
MGFWQRVRNIATESQGDEILEEISLVRDARGNWVNETTGKIIEYSNEPEEEDADADD